MSVPGRPSASTSTLTRRSAGFTRRTLHPVWIRYLVAIATYAIVFGLWQVEPVPLSVHLAGVLVMAISIWPIAYWYRLGSSGVPMFELICISYGLQYSTPLYLQPNQIVAYNSQMIGFTWDETFQSLLLAALGLASMVAAYYWLLRTKRVKRIPRIDLKVDPKRRPRYLVSALVCGFGTVVLQSHGFAPNGLSPLGIAVRLLNIQFLVAVVLITYRVHERTEYRARWTALLAIVLGAALLLGLAGGTLEGTLLPLALVILVRWHATRKLPVRALLVGLFAFAVLNSAKAEYRNSLAYTSANTGVVGRASAWLDTGRQALQQTLTGDVLQNSQDRFRQSTQRLDLLHVFALVHASTPSRVAYYNGTTYGSLFYSWIPRAVWPDKPTATSPIDQLGVDYGLILPFQTSTTKIGIGQLAEAYANFGLAGLVFIMALQGLILAALNRSLNGPESEGGRAIYMAVLVYFLNGIGTGTAIEFGTLVQDLLPSAVLMHLIVSRRDERAANTGGPFRDHRTKVRSRPHVFPASRYRDGPERTT